MGSNLAQQVGTRVHRAREEAGITKARFCLMVGISRPYLDKIEAGEANITLRILEKVAQSVVALVTEE